MSITMNGQSKAASHASQAREASANDMSVTRLRQPPDSLLILAK